MALPSAIEAVIGFLKSRGADLRIVDDDGDAFVNFCGVIEIGPGNLDVAAQHPALRIGNALGLEGTGFIGGGLGIVELAGLELGLAKGKQPGGLELGVSLRGEILVYRRDGVGILLRSKLRAAEAQPIVRGDFVAGGKLGKILLGGGIILRIEIGFAERAENLGLDFVLGIAAIV